MPKNDHDNWHLQETYKSMMTYGSNAIRFALLVNGGAVIALLTFLGDLVAKDEVSVNMAWPLSCFLLGIVAGGIANITAYMIQLTLFNEGQGLRLRLNHEVWLYGTLLLIVASVLLFGAGSILALLELRSYT